MPLQKHIHLSSVQDDVSDEEDITKWKALDRIDTPQVFMTVKRGITGRLKVFTAHVDGDPIQLTNYKYTVKVAPEHGYTLEERMAQLKYMNGRTVYLVDHFHPDDGDDHSAHVRRMVITIGEFPPFSVGMERFNVDIDLTDHTLE